MDFDPTGKYLCSCSEDKMWSVWEIQHKDCQNKGLIPNFHMRAIYSISWSKVPLEDSYFIATAAADNRICVFEINQESLKEQNFQFNVIKKQNMAHDNDINCIQFCPQDGSLLASSADDAVIKIWRVSAPEKEEVDEEGDSVMA